MGQIPNLDHRQGRRFLNENWNASLENLQTNLVVHFGWTHNADSLRLHTVEHSLDICEPLECAVLPGGITRQLFYEIADGN
jgi:hypothetical protein